jgi:hypothetical protein
MNTERAAFLSEWYKVVYMNILDIRHGVRNIIELKGMPRNKMKHLKMPAPVRIFMREESVILAFADESAPLQAEPADEQNKQLLHRLLTRNLPNLSAVLDADQDGKITVMMRTFSSDCPIDLSIGIDDEFMDKAKKQMKFDDIKHPEADLSRFFLLDVNGTQYAVLGVHTEADMEDWLSDFVLAGKEGYIQIKRRTDGEGGVYFVADRIIRKLESSKYTFTLAKGKIVFQNATFAEKARLETLAVLNELNGSIAGYFNTWEKYGRIEQQIVFGKARKAGAVRYNGWKFEGAGLIWLHIENSAPLQRLADEAGKGTWLTLCEENPSSLLDHDFDIAEYQNFARNQVYIVSGTLAKDINVQEQRIYIRNLRDDQPPPKSGYVFLSLHGDIERFRRRNEAREKILSGMNHMPHLAMILEGRSIARPVKKRHEPISPAVKEEIFKGRDPTPKQKEAIDIAINTPDICIIQGPPGTGKTTVIRAILKRLNEISGTSEGIFGQNLVSAYQHDAVENVVEKVEILGMPAIKIGNRNNGIEDHVQVIERMVENWISEKLQILYDRYPQLSKNDQMAQFDDLYNSYLHSGNTVEDTLLLLEKVKELLMDKLSDHLMSELNRLISELRLSAGAEEDLSHIFLVRSVRGLPVTAAAYRDNGKQAIMEVVYRLEQRDARLLEPEIQALQSILKKRSLDETDFAELRALRKRLLVRLMPEEQIFSTRNQKAEVLSLLGRISDLLREEYYASAKGEEAVLREYISEYENSPMSVRNAIMEYVSVLGITNQQVMGYKAMSLLGGKNYYENVLVDEAARSNPLDLFIPMSMARDRIILVGDHRQLPHIVDEKIVEEIERGIGGENRSVIEQVNANIKESLFQNLLHKIKMLEQKDGIKRTITLDMQYRTHPVLGDFVSKNFYEKHDEGRIESPLAASEFSHHLPGLENKACVWYDVPFSEGGETGGMSKSRKIEAKKIAWHLKTMMDSDAAKGLSFGVIAFYREQVKTIFQELANAGIAVKTEDEEGNEQYEIIGKYKEEMVGGKKIEKLRIGTVDAFQGMEFDVVYLSMVRSNPYPNDTPEQQKKKYGHLMAENRLCVSMSRQKRLLIVAGDSGMLKGPGAEEAVPALVNYYALCQGEKQYGQII